jgi:dTDP-4-amino-4,6-dideoxygalactose transaminase
MIPFSRPTLRGQELKYVREALEGLHLAGHGPFTRRVEDFLTRHFNAPMVLLTNSCSAALEIAALLSVRPGDEVIAPSFTFPTTASAFVRCGATIVFADVDAETLNIDPAAVEAAVTPRTRAIVGVHYAGVGCDVDALSAIAASAGAIFVEDAAHAFGATYRNRPLGTFGSLAAISFHETKNVTSGEGGALIVNDDALMERAQFIRDCGTNRMQFLNRMVNEYTWVDLGSAHAPSDLTAALLLAQIEDLASITSERLALWGRYHEAFAPLEQAGRVRRPCVPLEAGHNGHIYRLLIDDASRRADVLAALQQQGIGATFHYVPLHSSPAGRKHGRVAGSMAVTHDIASRIIRLPLYNSLTKSDQETVIQAVECVLS